MSEWALWIFVLMVLAWLSFLTWAVNNIAKFIWLKFGRGTR